MRPSQRHDKVIQLLLQSGVVTVPQLVELLQVSEVTVRNDLRALEKQGKLIRTHGGAALGNLPRSHHKRTQATGSEQRQPDRHHRIAQRAAALVNEGETILLLNSALTRAMADELLKVRALTVLTNSLHIATTLRRNPANTVMLMGGQLRADADTLDGPMATRSLATLRVQKAFLTCDGLTPEQGFADDDIASAQLKATLLPHSHLVIALAEGPHIGRSGLMSFAAANQVHHLITTEEAPEAALNSLRADGVQVTVCSQRLTQIPTDTQQPQRWRIGFANLTEQQEFAVAVRQGLENTARAHKHLELVLADNATDPENALAIARDMLEKRVDLLIEYQQDEHSNYVVMDMCRSAGVPVVAIDIPMPGATYFGADNYRAGTMAAEAAIRWIKKHWGGQLDKIVSLEQPESGDIPATRIRAQIDRLRTAFSTLNETDIVRCETHGDLEGSHQAAIQALRNIPWNKHVLFIGINFNSALGSLAAAEALDRQAYTAVISQNASARIRHELARRNPMLIGAVDYFPQHYGAKVIPLVLALLEKHPVPPAVYTEHLLLTPENVQQVYASEGDS